MNPLRYVVIEGPIGAGKSTLARRLAEHWEVDLLAEAPEDNPFLPRFYRSMPHHALSTQLSFLLQRSAAARSMIEGEFKGRPVVSDFLFEKDGLFARANLDAEELALYRQLTPRILPEYPSPDLVIYLEASEDVLLSRVAERACEYEVNFPDGYLKRVHEAYRNFFYEYDAAPLLTVNTDHLNLLEGDEDFELLLRCISEMRGQRSYFNKSA
ncbi:deoxynucleoside kinase [Craterilacuibacter sp. RT1T]|uniref:deoxynucleoside kinase n=1 Tax=Craterilacuibacter sp. RT1T TaxID=2942211 RepID=UPI0020BF9460|nr:deoxynucleoside kinase [Craterilacuibacter sp. RT1T]MCL6262358.1 deoxynucleoside kinase [Craterilacuibacter sp. RT1T]